MRGKVFVPAEEVAVHSEDGGEKRYQGVDVAYRGLDLHVAGSSLEVEICCLLGVAKLQEDIFHDVVEADDVSEERVD